MVGCVGRIHAKKCERGKGSAVGARGVAQEWGGSKRDRGVETGESPPFHAAEAASGETEDALQRRYTAPTSPVGHRISPDVLPASPQSGSNAVGTSGSQHKEEDQ